MVEFRSKATDKVTFVDRSLPTSSVDNAGRIAAIAFAIAKAAAIALLLTIAVEWVARGATADIGDFLLSAARPGKTTIVLLALAILCLDAALGRRYQSLLVLVPLTLIPAFVSNQKQLFLSDPLYPTDFLFARQIVELLPVMVSQRPWTAVAVFVGLIVAVVGSIYLWTHAWKRFPAIAWRRRWITVAMTLPVLVGFGSMMDYSQFSWLRDRLQVIPMMYDQKENYRHNGFLLAFAFNLPLANVAAPAGYGGDAMAKIPTSEIPFAGGGNDHPDVIVLMSESLWDPTRMTNVNFSADPMPVMREHASGNSFSPEFGGMTANVEFEALTGFSNAFLPYGSIPYQQYVRRPLPSLATFFRAEGYAARAIHPYQSWFWNRSEVYKAFGFEDFLSEENLPALDKRGFFASDDALFKEIMRQGDGMDRPFFFFSVTLQGHGPYEPNRYARNTIDVKGSLSEDERSTLATYTQGVKEADDSLKMLMDWAAKRERETIIVVFGDHLPPLGKAYVTSGYMADQVATRKAPLDVMKREHETPLMIWSSRNGTQDVGTISPAFISRHVVSMAGFKHPYYTEFLGKVEKKYPIVDRYMLVSRDGDTKPDWSMKGHQIDPLIRDFRYIQHDMMFGKQYGVDRMFPSHAWIAQPES